jgi:DNA-binding NarL/FixJ family response regulator
MILEQLGSRSWAEIAAGELKRVGSGRHGTDELSPTEERVATLAASGLRNREIAQRVFLSPKTVEANLAHVYRKLGVRSRAELAARMGDRSKNVEM